MTARGASSTTNELTIPIEASEADASGVTSRDGVSKTAGRRAGRFFVTSWGFDVTEAVIFLADVFDMAFFEEDAFWNVFWTGLVALERVVIAAGVIRAHPISTKTRSVDTWGGWNKKQWKKTEDLASTGKVDSVTPLELATPG